MSTRLILYTGTMCRLCDQAKMVIYPLLPAGVSVREINIDSDPALKQRYGTTIPVFSIVDEAGNPVVEKGWPFTSGQVKKMLSSI